MPTSKPEKKEPKKPLSVTHPELAKEADGWDASTVVAGSNKKLQWICGQGHKWSTAVAARAIRKLGCPICSGQKILPGFNDLSTLHPEIARQAFGWDPKLISKGSNKKFEWICDLGHIWTSNVANRTRRGDGCTICSNHVTLPGFNDLATVFPDIARQADGWDPTLLAGQSSKKMNWKCDQGHRWRAQVASRTNMKSGCPICSGKVVLSGFNDLQTTNPKLALQAFGWDPTTITRASNKKMEWKCEEGHFWESTVNNRNANKNCPTCSGNQVLIGHNDLATTHPELANEAFGWDPETFTSGSSRSGPIDWRCSQGHIWKATIASRGSGNGCPVCAGQKVWPGYNDLATTHPEIAKQAYGWDPSTVMAGTDKKLDWICNLGHVWKVRGAERMGGSNCPICLGQKVLVGFNDLATTNPSVASEAFEWNPTTLTAGSGLKRKFKCEHGHTWVTAIATRTGFNKSGCPTCSKTGFDPSADGYLYFLMQEDWEMFQIGITNVPDDRLNRHKRNGWKVLELRGPMDGHLTQQWETAILRMLKKKGADLSNEKIAGKFDGYSEAWTKATFPVVSIKELMRLTDEFEESKLGD